MLLRIIFLVFISIFLATSCKKDEVIADFEGTKATVLRDCTGTYLRIGSKDYQVCNKSLIDKFADNVIVTVIYTPVSTCDLKDYNGPICMMYREHEGWIEISKVK